MSAPLRFAGRSRRGRVSRLALSLAAGIALATVATSACADDQAKAEELFDDGRRLMRSRSTLDKACKTLEESLKLWDRGDTVLNLALCHRLQGKTATAWKEFDRAITHGIKVRFPEAIAEAQKQRAELFAILSKLTVTVPPATAALEGLTVEVDGSPWPRDRWNTAIVLDPGRVRVRAQAKGYKPFETQIEVGANKDEKNVVVVLEAEPPPPPPPTPPPAPVGQPARPLWPWIVGGAGVALGAGAIASELLSRAAHSELDSKCGTDRQRCPTTYNFEGARSREVAGFGLFLGLGTGAALALGAAGVGFGLSSRTPAPATMAPKTAPPPSVSLVVSPTSIGVAGSF